MMDNIVDYPTVYNCQSTKYDITRADFLLFVTLWNQKMKFTDPQIHRDIAKWLEFQWLQGNKRLLLMAFRSAGKSTIVGLFCAWLLYHNNDLRILVLAADYTLSKKMVYNVKRILESHPLTQEMKPNNAEQWASDRFTIKRMFESRDPSMMAKGITSNITGSRADIIISDDVEVPNTSDTPAKREELRDRLKEIEYVLVPDGTQLYVGTPHHYNTIYAKEPRTELGEDTALLKDFTHLEIPILDKDGNSAWIERYSEAKIKRMKRDAGPNKFASQMMLEPRNINEGHLNLKRLKFYDDALDYTKELRTLFLGTTKLSAASAFWDPAFGGKSGDNSVLAIIYKDQEGHNYLHHITYITINEGAEEDEASQQCKIVAQIAKDHYLPSLTVETNGIGKFLPSMLRNALAKAKAPCSVQECHQSKKKADRIIDAFDAILAAERLSIHKSVLKTPFMTEMQEWRPKASDANKGYDDGLDAVAGALAQSPERINRIYAQGSHNWMRNASSHKADTDFKV